MGIQASGNSSLDLYTFSKVGDCQMTSATFLEGFADGKYTVPDGYAETVSWFSESMQGESVTAGNGRGVNSVLNPRFGLAAGNMECERNETPPDCKLKLRTRRPAFVLFATGTNWKLSGESGILKEILNFIAEQ
jgi:hypothetical protein